MLTYILQVNLCWLLFYGLYFALLSRETFFKLNRIYLIISLLCGLVIPLSMAYFREEVRPMSIVLQPFVVSANLLQQGMARAETWSIWIVLRVLYGIGGAVLGLRFLVGIFKISRMYRAGEKTVFKGFTLVNTEGVVSPFSFFRWVFINPFSIQKDDFQQIILHEKAHVTQRHSYDVVFLEILNVAFWWSPLIWFYKKSLVNVHEYLADEAVLKTTSTPQYGRLLLRQIESGGQPALANNFFSQIKKRIIMMTRNPSHRTALIRYTFAIPLFLLLVSFFSIPNNSVMASTEVLSDNVEKAVNTFDVKIKEKLNDNNILPLKNTIIAPKLANQPLTFQLAGGYTGGTISAETFAKQKGIVAFEIVNGQVIYRKIKSFVLFRVPRRDDPIQANNTEGGDFNGDALKVIGMAKSTDYYVFTSVTFADNNYASGFNPLSFTIDDPNIVSKKDTVPPLKTFSTLDKLDGINPNDIERMDVDKEKRMITITLKNGKTESYILTEKEAKEGIGIPKRSGETPKTDANSPVFTIVETQPEFPEGAQAMFKWLGSNIKYPNLARINRIEGTVYVGFVVEIDGSISNVTVKRGVKGVVRDTITIMEINGVKGNKVIEKEDHSLDIEASRIIATMPKWKPGKANGQLVRVAYTLPIKFRLE